MRSPFSSRQQWGGVTGRWANTIRVGFGSNRRRTLDPNRCRRELSGGGAGKLAVTLRRLSHGWAGRAKNTLCWWRDFSPQMNAD